MLELLRRQGIRDERVLRAMARVPRHCFVPEALQPLAYADQALELSSCATISQPYMVARMTEAASLSPADRVLEVGTGSGYQAALLAELAQQVFTVELDPDLAVAAAATLRQLGYAHRVQLLAGDGNRGWPEFAPFQAILVTAAAPTFPRTLFEQLAEGGRLIFPEAAAGQSCSHRLYKVERQHGQPRTSLLGYCRFVPLRSA